MAVVLKATRRNELGSRKASRIRTGGNVPGVIYGHGEPVVPVTLSLHEVVLAVRHNERLLEIDLEGKTENVLVKEVQYDHMGNDILHIDLARVSLDERVTVTVPVVLRGTPVGAAEGGVIQQIAAKATIECLVMEIPDELRVSVAEMKVGDMLRMKDLPLPKKHHGPSHYFWNMT